MALSPLWFWFYMLGHEINLLSHGTIFFFLTYWAVCLVIAAMILRFAPGGEGNMAMFAAAPIALYGFAMAATWIDFVADHLVSLLDFMGIILHIPGSIMGLTVLYVLSSPPHVVALLPVDLLWFLSILLFLVPGVIAWEI